MLLNIDAPLLDQIDFFYIKAHHYYDSIKAGQNEVFYKRKYKQPGYIFDLNVKHGKTQVFYIKVKNYDQIQVPFEVTTQENFFTLMTTYNFLFGIYCGVMLIMMIYNLFIYFIISVR